ncbi:hypothetical protein [Lacticaseibacillus brantae]|uniref:Uncharacterized protein n=1 Tax=Lacticaseibacillus brantae DSM 23927 TaxID=1423727 RepID=A0A0R2AXZ7_9LACO|nr:hypothetical protein [Lacticaseibacillus brantae]KRM71346.1 hypothetical protein FC34_GL001826 [Lacticaseibacillus brantae DSM 23927]
MEINVQTYQNAIAEGNYEQVQKTVDPMDLKEQGLAQFMASLYESVQAATQKNQLIQATLEVTYKEPVLVSLETSVINLPMADYKKINNFLEVEEIVPVNLYLVITSQWVNVSGLRIDKMTDVASYLADFTVKNAEINDAIYEKLDFIEAEMSKPQPVAKEVPANKRKPATKRTTTKTAAAKKPAAKTTRKKAPAKKTATKKPAAKK